MQFTDPLVDAPYRRWAAKAFAAQLLVEPANSTAVIGGYDVPAGPPAEFPRSQIGYGGVYSGNVVTLGGVAQNFGRSSSDDVTLRFWWNPEAGDPAWGAPPLSATSPQLGTGVISGGGTSGDDPWYVTFPGGHGPTATRASYELDASDEEIETALVRFGVDITLAAAPTHERDFYMTVRSDDSLAPVANGTGWQSTLVGVIGARK